MLFVHNIIPSVKPSETENTIINPYIIVVINVEKVVAYLSIKSTSDTLHSRKAFLQGRFHPQSWSPVTNAFVNKDKRCAHRLHTHKSREKSEKSQGKGLSFPGRTDRPGSVHYNPQVVRGKKEAVVNKAIIYFLYAILCAVCSR